MVDWPFNDPEYLNTTNQNTLKEKTINHHSGPLAMSYRADAHLLKGHKAPHVAAFIDAFEPNVNAKENVAAVKHKLGELMEQRAGESSEVCVQSFFVEEQVAMIEDEMGVRPGTSIRGIKLILYLFCLLFC